MYKTSY